MMKVSVVTPSLNQGEFLESAIKSVLGQTYGDIEYIVVDGGSTDGSVDLIKQHSGSLAKWVSEQDAGQSDAIKKGFDQSSGDILCWLNADDAFRLDTVSTAVDFLKENPEADMVYGNRLAVDEKGRILYQKRMLPFCASGIYVSLIVGQESCFWRRKIYEKVGGINAARNFSMDYELFSKIAQQGRIKYCPDLWSAFRIHPDSRTMKEYADVGRRDVAEVQESVWGRHPSRFSWQLISTLVKLWGLSGEFKEISALDWPEGLLSDERLSIKERFKASFHEGSLFRKIGDLLP